MKTRRELMAQSLARILGQLDINDLRKIHDAEMNAWHASAQLGNSAQLQAQNISRQVTAEVFAALPDYAIGRLESEFKSTARDLEVIKNG